MKKAKSIRGFFEAAIAGRFSYVFSPDFYTAVAEENIETLKSLYGSVLQFEEMTPEQKLEEAGVTEAELPAESEETPQ